jgi:hypothetical protein
MSPSPGFAPSKRQLWNPPTTAAATPTPYCTAFPLPANGVISLADSVITLTTNVVFQPACTGGVNEFIEGYPSVIADWKDPFYASTTPQTYVIAAATVIAWILVFMLVITPRTTFFGTSVSHPGLGGKHGIIGGANGGGSSLGVGSRPWLQKVAAFTVAVSLTIATADTFKSLEKQYTMGYMDATAMREDVMGSLEIRITRVISDIFLWLAQVQTLIRLFPRHKEKVIIKWIGFALIVCDSTFSCLNSFYANTTLGSTKPRHFVDAIPALSYLFELALGLLYAAWVIYYSMTKRRYAFYHVKMRSITLIALLSFVAVLTPVVFFVTDVSNSDVAGWGDYFRWVGAAAASVIVWEWVERIEAIECDDKKDGILGREIFDGDEMLDVNPSSEVIWNSGRRGLARLRNGGRRGNDDDEKKGGDATSAMEKGLHGFTSRFRRQPPPAPKHFPLGRAYSHRTEAPTDGSRTGTAGSGTITFGRLPRRRGQRTHDTGITPPPAVASPVSRTDTTSAASTVYVVRYDDGGDVPQPIRRRVDASGNAILSQDHRDSTTKEYELEEDSEEPRPRRERGLNGRWHTVANPFKRKRASPPAEVQKARDKAEPGPTRSMTPAHNFSKWDFKNRLGVLAAETGERFRDRRPGRGEDEDIPVTIIPAQPRGSTRTWSPEVLIQQQQAQQARRTHDRSPAAAGALSTDEPPTPADLSHSTTLTSNSLSAAEAASRDSNTPRAIETTTSASPVVVQSPRRHLPRSQNSFSRQCDPPPRADDISPSAGSAGTVTVVPAPRRSPLRAVSTTPPMAHNAASTSNAALGDELATTHKGTLRSATIQHRQRGRLSVMWSARLCV